MYSKVRYLIINGEVAVSGGADSSRPGRKTSATKVESALDLQFVLLSFVPLPTSRFALIQTGNRVLPKKDKQAQRYQHALRGHRAATVELEMREFAIAVLQEGPVGQILECQ
jgi:hypothetical protein